MATSPTQENEEYLKNWEKFISGLEKLTKETGFGIQTCGGVFYDDPKTIKNVSYSNDYTSGDLDYNVTNKPQNKQVKPKGKMPK